MKRQTIKQIFFLWIILCLTTSCASITKLFPKEPRPFQSKKFDSEQWKSGDYQTRGEMADNLRELISKEMWKKSADEVRQTLGEPDVITQAECCEVGRAMSPSKVEVWLYYLEIEKDYWLKPEKSEAEQKIIPQAFKLYFRKGEPQRFETVIGDRIGNHSRIITMVGMVSFEQK